jgi:hypothetical protein
MYSFGTIHRPAVDRWHGVTGQQHVQLNYSWGWAKTSPEKCRADLVRSINGKWCILLVIYTVDILDVLRDLCLVFCCSPDWKAAVRFGLSTVSVYGVDSNQVPSQWCQEFQLEFAASLSATLRRDNLQLNGASILFIANFLWVCFNEFLFAFLV